MNTPSPQVRRRLGLSAAIYIGLLTALASPCVAAGFREGGLPDESRQSKVEATGIVPDNANGGTVAALASVSVPEPSNALIGFVLGAGLLRRKRATA